MNILFYVEPLIEKCDPFWKSSWLTYCCANIIRTLDKSGGSFSYVIAVNEPLSSVELDLDVPRVTFTQEDLLAPFQGGYLEASIAWYQQSFSAEQLRYYVTLMKRKLGSFIPDIIITFSPAPFFREAYPDALLLHHEYSIFSRSPYPESWFLDPCGMSEHSYLNRFAKQSVQQLHPAELALVKRFRMKCLEIAERVTPFKEIIYKEKRRFRQLVLLPLQDSSYYSFDGIVPFPSQYDYLVHVLEHVPEDVGVLVTMHPDYPVIKESAFDFLRKRYKNCIYHPEFSWYYAASQYLVKDADAVLTVSSTVGLQTMFFGTKLATLGNTFGYLTDCRSLRDLPAFLEGTAPDNDAILHWIVTRYTIMKDDLTDPAWLSSFLQRALDYFRERKCIGPDFFQPVKACSDIYETLLAQMESKGTGLPVMSKVRSRHAQLYFDVGEGFSETLSAKQPVPPGSWVKTITFNALPSEPIRSLRFDPLDDQTVIDVIEVRAVTGTGSVRLEPRDSNAVLAEDGCYYFSSDDPSISFDLHSEPMLLTELQITVRYRHYGKEALLETMKRQEASHREGKQQLQSLVEQKGAQIAVLEEWLAERRREVARLGDVVAKRDLVLRQIDEELVRESLKVEENIRRGEVESAQLRLLLQRKDEELEALGQRIEEMLCSKSWKLTAPLRAFATILQGTVE